MASKIKQEVDSEPSPGTSGTSLVDAQSRIVELCQEFPNGVVDSILQNDMPNLATTTRVQAINHLLSKEKIVVKKNKQGQLVYCLNTKNAGNAKLKGGDVEEKIIYNIIKEVGNKGIWTRDIRFKSNLNQTVLNKIIKSLEGKKAIKAVTSVSASKKKLYMLYELTPDRSITGGAWYSQDQEYESEFVDVLHQMCLRFLLLKVESAKETPGGPMMVRNASFTTSRAICNYISELGISKVALSLEDIEVVLDTLVYDGRIEKSVACETNGEQTKTYRAVETLMPSAGLVRIPCGVCPVINNCGIVGSIQPKKCVYYDEWME